MNHEPPRRPRVRRPIRWSAVALVLGLGVPIAFSVPADAGARERHHVVFTLTVAQVTIGAPLCDASGACLIPAQGHGLRGTGDFTVADGVTLASVRLLPHGNAASGLSTLVGTLGPCGTGMIAMRFNDTHDDATPDASSGRWQIVPGGGSGDLTDVSGHGRTRFAPDSSELRGEVTC